MMILRMLITIAAAITILAAPAQGQDAPSTEGALSEMVMGDENAPVTLMEYASVTCNHCAHWHDKVFPAIKEDYIDTGKIRFVLREYPTIPGHPALIARSYAGTMLARCAADRNGSEAYFKVMSILFDQQETWAFGEDARGELLKIAAAEGIDEAGFDACISRDDLKDHIDENIGIAAEKYEIGGTPGFIIGGEYKRIFTYEDVAKALDEAIAAAG